MKTIIVIAAILQCTWAWGGLLDNICDAAIEHGETTTETEYRADPKAHADDFCALARFEPHKAARQLSKSTIINRRFDNSNRFYFDPRLGNYNKPGVYIQILSPEWPASYSVHRINETRFKIVYEYGSHGSGDKEDHASLRVEPTEAGNWTAVLQCERNRLSHYYSRVDGKSPTVVKKTIEDELNTFLQGCLFLN